MDDVVRYAGRHGRFGQGRVRTGGIEGEASDIPSIIFVAAAGAQCSLPLVAGLLVLVGRRAGGRAGGRALRFCFQSIAMWINPNSVSETGCSRPAQSTLFSRFQL